jgi:hypothetical protein
VCDGFTSSTGVGQQDRGCRRRAHARQSPLAMPLSLRDTLTHLANELLAQELARIPGEGLVLARAVALALRRSVGARSANITTCGMIESSRDLHSLPPTPLHATCAPGAAPRATRA